MTRRIHRRKFTIPTPQQDVGENEGSMTIRDFIRGNRKEIDRAILGAMYRHDGKGGKGTIPEDAKLNDKERHAWVLNDEGLYRWARSAGVKI